MGGGGSAPRKVTIEEEGNGVVKVSEGVARRLVGKPEVVSEKVEQARKQERVTLTPQETDEGLEKLRSQYENRIMSLEEQNKKLYKTTTEQFAQAVEEVEKKFLKSTASPICDDLQQQVLQCYNENQKETLNCSQIVKAYSSCVQGQGETILTKKEECQPCLLAQMARGPCGPKFIEAYDCYLAEKDMEQCGMLYLEMKKCWDKHPDYGYDSIVNRAYADSPGDSPMASKTAREPTSAPSSETPAKPKADATISSSSGNSDAVSQQESRKNNVGS